MKLNHLHYFKVLLLSLLLFGFSNYVNAQPPAKRAATKPATVQSAAGIIDNFFKKYKALGPDSAVNYLFSTNKYFSNPVGIAQLKAKLDSLHQSLGDYIGRELIVQKTASPSLVLYSYLVKHEIQPVRFTFIFYRPHSDWVFYRFLFDDQMDLELEDGARISNKHP